MLHMSLSFLHNSSTSLAIVFFMDFNSCLVKRELSLHLGWESVGNTLLFLGRLPSFSRDSPESSGGWQGEEE